MLLSICIFITYLLAAYVVYLFDARLRRLEDAMADLSGRGRPPTKFEQQVILSLTRIERKLSEIFELVKSNPNERIQQLADQLNDAAAKLKTAVNENQ